MFWVDIILEECIFVGGVDAVGAMRRYFHCCCCGWVDDGTAVVCMRLSSVVVTDVLI